MSEIDLQGLLEVASSVLAGVYVEESSVFAEAATGQGWQMYDVESP